ncbi:MAG: amino acid ABC transporter permease [Rhodoferax sp.]|nr:amino acid ABC transporter permease [Rhodoferax sp.]
MNYQWNWTVFWLPNPEGTGTFFTSLLAGLGWTVLTAVCAWLLALALGTVVGVLRTTAYQWLVRAGNLYVELFRNIPLLVQMLLWYFVLPELLPVAWGDALKQMPNASFCTAVVCLGFYTSVRVAEQVKAGILALPRGQAMSGRALGLTLPQTYRYVLLPQALRIMLPPLTNDFLNTIKNTSVALTIGLTELTARTRALESYTYQTFEAFAAATLIYILVNVSVSQAMRLLERRLAVPGLIQHV